VSSEVLISGPTSDQSCTEERVAGYTLKCNSSERKQFVRSEADFSSNSQCLFGWPSSFPRERQQSVALSQGLQVNVRFDPRGLTAPIVANSFLEDRPHRSYSVSLH
jgi:hypothetical protein